MTLKEEKSTSEPVKFFGTGERNISHSFALAWILSIAVLLLIFKSMKETIDMGNRKYRFSGMLHQNGTDIYLPIYKEIP